MRSLPVPRCRSWVTVGGWRISWSVDGVGYLGTGYRPLGAVRHGRGALGVVRGKEIVIDEVRPTAVVGSAAASSASRSDRAAHPRWSPGSTPHAAATWQGDWLSVATADNTRIAHRVTEVRTAATR
ncbi:hypothetical protein [Alloactinosynnema sp. L-07]|uniref:hypothetical protein n=1 Tax=Alloactinosynnema sp. L-07 TaxID=1653480 RepID=UPI00065F0066|nr:hypothetical protein [Alloactinosynnema sp. L-07]CRK59391.1 hypothetical protein [Alloactinosynnema sp. L-07]